MRALDHAAGAMKNLKAYHSMKSAIDTARKHPDSAVQFVGGEAQVASATTAGTRYSVQLSPDGEQQPRCSCTAGHKGQMCWHIAKVLLSLGATENQLLRYMGTLLGAAGGGFAGLRGALSRAAQSGADSAGGRDSVPLTAEKDSAAEQTLPTDDCAYTAAGESGDPSPAVAEGDGGADVAGADQCVSNRQRAEAALAALTEMTCAWSDDSEYWGFLLVAAKRAQHEVEKAVAVGSQKVHSLDFLTNQNAPAGNQMRRLQSWLEQAGGKHHRRQKRAQEGSGSCSQSEDSSDSGDAVHPFVSTTGLKKLKSVHDEIKAKSRLHKSSHHLDPSPNASVAPTGKTQPAVPSSLPAGRAATEPSVDRPRRAIKPNPRFRSS